MQGHISNWSWRQFVKTQFAKSANKGINFLKNLVVYSIMKKNYSNGVELEWNLKWFGLDSSEYWNHDWARI